MEEALPARETAHRQDTVPRQAADPSDGIGGEGLGECLDARAHPRMLSSEGAARLLSQPDTDGTNNRDDSPKRWSALDLEPAEQPRWLADSRLPRAATCLLLGDEGIGKSLFWVLVVAHVTTGTPFPELGIPPRSPGRAILVLTEDDWGTVVRPRLEAAKADLSRIEIICTERDGGGSPIFPRDIELLYAEPTPDIVVVDCCPRQTAGPRRLSRPLLKPAMASGPRAAVRHTGQSSRLAGVGPVPATPLVSATRP
jgi:hypothetical protein